MIEERADDHDLIGKHVELRDTNNHELQELQEQQQAGAAIATKYKSGKQMSSNSINHYHA